MKISIIIPVYNQEKYLEKCLNSILANDFLGYEIIAIDDASTDKSVEIIKKYKHVKLIRHKKNQHIGITRNDGLKIAEGKYIAFIDPDDYIDKDFLKRMYENAEKNNSDLVICDYINVCENHEEKIKGANFTKTNIKENPRILYDISKGPCNKLYRREMLEKNNIKFAEHLKYEDIPFVVGAIYYSNIITHEDAFLNYFTIHKKSETTTRDESVFDLFKHIDFIKKLAKENNLYLNDLIVSLLFGYTSQQRYQKSHKVANKFIDEAFLYLKNNNIDYKHNLYIKSKPFYQTIIEKNKILTKLYCNTYIIISKSKILMALYNFLYNLITKTYKLFKRGAK